MRRRLLTLTLVLVACASWPAGAVAKTTFHVGHPRAYFKDWTGGPEGKKDCYLAVPLRYRSDEGAVYDSGYRHVFDPGFDIPVYRGTHFFGDFSGGLSPHDRLDGAVIAFSYGYAEQNRARRKLFRVLRHRRWIRLISKTKFTGKKTQFKRTSHRYSARALMHCRLVAG